MHKAEYSCPNKLQSADQKVARAKRALSTHPKAAFRRQTGLSSATQQIMVADGTTSRDDIGRHKSPSRVRACRQIRPAARSLPRK